MKKVDILMSTTLKSIIGPVQTIKRIINNKSFYQDNGYEISVFTNDDLRGTILTNIKDKDSHFIKRLKEYSRYLSMNTRLYSAYRIYRLFIDSKRLLKYYNSKNRNPDVIVFHSIFDCYVYLKYFHNGDRKIILFTHSDGLMFKMLLSYYPKLQGGIVEKKLMKIADFVMSNVSVKPCIARIEEKNLLSTYPQLNGKTCLVVNAIDDFTEDQNKKVDYLIENHRNPKYRFVCTGSINGRKGQRIIIDALKSLSLNALRDIHISFVGDGPERISLEDIVNKSNLSKYISFEGSIKNTDVYLHLAKANIFILMTKMEGLPIALIEALRNGLALVSTNVSGIPELVIDNINGKLLNPDVNELKILFESLDKYNWEEMGKQSRKMFEEYYTFDRMRLDYLKMLDKATV